MYTANSPVDELAKIRSQLAQLRARETTLEARFIELQASGPFTGFSGDVIVDQTAHEVFDISKLPNAILNDARFHSLRRVTSVRIEPHIDTSFMPEMVEKSPRRNLVEHQ